MFEMTESFVRMGTYLAYIVAFLSLGSTVVAGYLIMASGGNPQKSEGGKRVLTASITALGLSGFGFLVVSLVVANLTERTSPAVSFTQVVPADLVRLDTPHVQYIEMEMPPRLSNGQLAPGPIYAIVVFTEDVQCAGPPPVLAGYNIDGRFVDSGQTIWHLERPTLQNTPGQPFTPLEWKSLPPWCAMGSAGAFVRQVRFEFNQNDVPSQITHLVMDSTTTIRDRDGREANLAFPALAIP